MGGGGVEADTPESLFSYMILAPFLSVFTTGVFNYDMIWYFSLMIDKRISAELNIVGWGRENF